MSNPTIAIDPVQKGSSLYNVNVAARRTLGECIVLHNMLIK